MFRNCMKSEDPRTLLQRRLDGDPMRVKPSSGDSESECCDRKSDQPIEFGCDKPGVSVSND